MKQRVFVLILWAAMAVQETIAADSISQRAHPLESVAVQGELPRTASPVPLRQFEMEDFPRNGINGVGDALYHLPGIILRDYGGAGGLQTVSVRGMGAVHTAVVYDGIPVSDVQTGQVDFSRYQLAAVSAVGLRVGDDYHPLSPARTAASASTIMLATPAPDTTSGSFALEQGSWNRWEGRLAYNIRPSKFWAFTTRSNALFAGNHYPFDLQNGRVVTRKHRTNSHMAAFHAEANAFFSPSPQSHGMGKVFYYDNHRRLPGQVVLYNGNNHERQHDRQALVQAAWQQRLGRRLELKMLGKYDWQSAVYHDKSAVYPGGQWQENYRQGETYLSGALAWQPFLGCNVSYAVDYFHNHLRAAGPARVSAERHSLLQSLTLTEDCGPLRLSGRLLASVYAHRANGDAARNLTRLSPSAAAAVRLLPRGGLYVRVFWKDIFRLPTFTESYYYHLGNPDLLPERTRQWGAGLACEKKMSAWWPKMAFSVDVYRHSVMDKIVSVPLNMHLWRTLNVARVRGQGVEAGVSAQFRMAAKHHIFLYTQATWQQTQDKSDAARPNYNKQLAYLPHFSGSGAVAWENPWLNLSISVVGCTSRWTTHEHSRGTRLAGYAEWTATAWRDVCPWRRLVKLKASVQNLLDRQYQLVTGYPMPGRAYRVSCAIPI